MQEVCVARRLRGMSGRVLRHGDVISTIAPIDQWWIGLHETAYGEANFKHAYGRPETACSSVDGNLKGRGHSDARSFVADLDHLRNIIRYIRSFANPNPR